MAGRARLRRDEDNPLTVIEVEKGGPPTVPGLGADRLEQPDRCADEQAELRVRQRDEAAIDRVADMDRKPAANAGLGECLHPALQPRHWSPFGHGGNLSRSLKRRGMAPILELRWRTALNEWCSRLTGTSSPVTSASPRRATAAGSRTSSTGATSTSSPSSTSRSPR